MKINAKDFYAPLYRLLDAVTPLKKDCGQLCDGVCCKDTDQEAGMLLFPGEEAMFENVSFAKIVTSHCEYGKDAVAKLLLCKGSCDRARRPLACRIFPLLPYRHTGGCLQIKMDPRAKGMCPLARSLSVAQLEPQFVQRVQEISNRILQLKDGPEYLDMLADLADMSDFLHKDG